MQKSRTIVEWVILPLILLLQYSINHQSPFLPSLPSLPPPSSFFFFLFFQLTRVCLCMMELTIFSFLRMQRFGFSNYQSMNMVHRTKQGSELWLGDYYAASNVSLLKQKNIRAVLTSAAMLNIAYPKEHGISHKTINAFDVPSYKMTPHFEEAFRFIDDSLQQGNNILVHCAAGISRSTTFVLVFLMRGQGMGLKQAMDYVRAKRSVICPNYGFQNELKRLQMQLKKNRQERDHLEKNNGANLTEKKAVLNFLNDDKGKRQEKLSFTTTAGGSKFSPANFAATVGGTGMSILNGSGFLRGKSVNYNQKRALQNPPERGLSNTKQYLSFKLESPKIVTIKK